MKTLNNYINSQTYISEADEIIDNFINEGDNFLGKIGQFVRGGKKAVKNAKDSVKQTVNNFADRLEKAAEEQDKEDQVKAIKEYINNAFKSENKNLNAQLIKYADTDGQAVINAVCQTLFADDINSIDADSEPVKKFLEVYKTNTKIADEAVANLVTAVLIASANKTAVDAVDKSDSKFKDKGVDTKQSWKEMLTKLNELTFKNT